MSSRSTAAGRIPRVLGLVAVAALAVAAVVGAYLVFEPSADASSEAIQRLARIFVDLGVPYREASGLVEFALNIALFVPGAAAAALIWRRVRWWQWVLVGFAVTVAVETLQGLFLDGRDGEPRDLVSNTLGAALGAGVGVLLPRLGAHASRGGGPGPSDNGTELPQERGSAPRPGGRSE